MGESLIEDPFGQGYPVSKSYGDLSFLECCCGPSCECQADTILHKEFCKQFELYPVVHIFQINHKGRVSSFH